jgi:hypothetical protein
MESVHILKLALTTKPIIVTENFLKGKSATTLTNAFTYSKTYLAGKLHRGLDLKKRGGCRAAQTTMESR